MTGWYQHPSKRSDGSLPPGTPNPIRPPLPTEVIAIIANNLMADKDPTTFISLSLINKATCMAVMPKLYHTVVLHTTHSIVSFFDSLVRVLTHSTSSVRATRQMHVRYVAKMAESWFSRVTHLDIAIQGIEALDEHSYLFKKLLKVASKTESTKATFTIESLHLTLSPFGEPNFKILCDVVTTYQPRYFRWHWSDRTRLWKGYDCNTLSLLSRTLEWLDADHLKKMKKAFAHWDMSGIESIDSLWHVPGFPLCKYRIIIPLLKRPDTFHPQRHFRVILRDLPFRALAPQELEKISKESWTSSHGPRWLIYNSDDIEKEEILSILPDIGPLRADQFKSMFHFIQDSSITDAKGEEWREWIKKGIWCEEEAKKQEKL